MKNRFFTILILRPAGARFRKLRFSYPFVSLIALVAVLLGAAGLYAPRLFVQLEGREVIVNRLENELLRLREERDAFESTLSDVSARLGAFEAQADLLAEELGVDGLPLADGAAGGPERAPAVERFWFESDFRGLRSRAATLERSFDELGQAFRERMSHLASTPNVMPVEGWFSHGYGWRKDPFGGEREFHGGIDLVAPRGTEIKAPADGVVSRAGRFADLGRSVDIAHGYGYVTRYAHMHEISVLAGDRVNRGDVIGSVGSSGRSTGPHLHYEVFRDGRRVNPWPYLGLSGG